MKQNSDDTATRAFVQPRHLQVEREKLLARIRRLYAMSCETESSPHEAEIALRRCQSLMARYGITEADLATSEFGRESFRAAGRRVPAHVKWFGAAISALHGVLFVTGGPDGAHFRGYDIDVRVARLSMEYLEQAVERALTTRRRTGDFPAGRSAAYDYRVAFAIELHRRVEKLVAERTAAERAVSHGGSALTVRKREIVERECGRGLASSSWHYRGTRSAEAASAGREDGAKVSLDPQVKRRKGAELNRQ